MHKMTMEEAALRLVYDITPILAYSYWETEAEAALTALAMTTITKASWIVKLIAPGKWYVRPEAEQA